MLPPIRIGIITRLIRNALVRTAALYSRSATVTSLRIGSSRGALGPGDADEDVLQLGPGDLEVPHLPALHQPREERLRIGARGEAQLLPAAEVGGLHHAGQVGQAAGVAVEVDVQRV